MIRFAEVSLGEGPTTSCRRCSSPPQVTPRFRPAAEIADAARDVVERWAEGPGPNVTLTGAEPFAHPELPAVVSSVVHAGVQRLRLDTDAIALGAPENASGVLAAGVRHVRVTLLGGTPGVHDVLAGSRPGLLEATLDGMRAVSAAADSSGTPLALSARVPVCRHNLRDLPAAVALAVEAGARHVLLEVADGGIDLASAAPWITAACDSGTVNSAWVEVAGLPVCLAPTHALHTVRVLRDTRVGLKPPACAGCGLDTACEGAAPGSAPDVLAALAPPEESEQLEAAIRRAYLAPTGPGEVE